MATSSLGTLILTVLQFAKTDELKLAAPALSTFFNNIAANTSKLNLANQLILLQVALLATFPQLEADVLKELDTLVQQEIVAAMAGSTAPVVAA